MNKSVFMVTYGYVMNDSQVVLLFVVRKTDGTVSSQLSTDADIDRVVRLGYWFLSAPCIKGAKGNNDNNGVFLVVIQHLQMPTTYRGRIKLSYIP